MGLYIKTKDGYEIEQRTSYSKIKYKYNNKEINEKEFIEKYNITIIDILNILNDSNEDMNKELLKYNFKIIELSIPEYIININNNQFNDIYTLEKISIFAKCFKLREINIPSTVTKIESGCFLNCSSLEKIGIPSSIKQIESSTFEDCKSLKELELPEGLKEIGESTFNNCFSLEKIKIPSTIKQIATSVFEDCISLKEIELPNGLKIIEDYAFNNCRSLEKIEIPSSIEYIDSTTFYICNNLKEIIFEDESYKEKEGLQDFIKEYRDIIKIKSLDDIIKNNTKNEEKEISKPDEPGR